MMLETHLRQAAAVLLESAIRIAPPSAHEWGQAMRSELDHVEGHWEAIMWALGGAGVLAKHALAYLFMPGRRGQDMPPDGGLFAKNISLRGAVLVAGGGCVLGALLFFAAPPFRQALRVSLRPWSSAFQVASGSVQPGLETLARRAEQRRDAEGLAFCAVRLENPRESARLADEAVRLNRDFLWVYAVVAMRHPEVTEIAQWIEILKRWNPENALFYLIEAERIERSHFRPSAWTPPTQEQNQAWQASMETAFQSPQFDDYVGRVAELNRTVVPRYRFYDPEEIESRARLDFSPVFVSEDSERFANLLLHAGANLEARGDQKGAREKYWTVARFGQVIDSQAHTGFEHWAGTTLQAMAYKPLEALEKKEGSPAQAAFFGYLATKFDPVTGERPKMTGEQVFGKGTLSRNATVLMISGLMMLIFSGLFAVAGGVAIFGRGRARTDAQRARPVAPMVAFTSAVGLLLSSATLYLTYRPYWYLYHGVILTGDRSQARDLHDLLMATQVPPGVPPEAYLSFIRLLGSWRPYFPFYFWAGVTSLGIIGLILILLRHSRVPPRANGLQHSPRVP
ncbi:MAG TPA: hypothetical protein VG206_08925 [Terriglobia bacterium]|nr:hypothetical protein [Terriglobia bacterium]